MIEEIPECELGVHNIDKPENRKIFTKYGYDVLKVKLERCFLNQVYVYKKFI